MMVYDPDFERIQVKGPRGRGGPEPPILLWSTVYLANLPFPAFMEFHLAYGPGLIGMVLGAWGLYAAGRWACRSNPQALRMVSHGGIAIAALQLLPVLQIVAGMLGFAAATVMGQGVGGPGDRTLPVVGALIATLVTGLVLIACAGVVGLVDLAIRSTISPSFREPVRGGRDGKCKS